MSNESRRPPMPLHDAAAPLAVIAIVTIGWLVAVLTRLAALAAAPDTRTTGFNVPTLGSWAPALAAAIQAGSLDPLIGAGGSRPLFWLVLGVLTVPLLAAVLAGVWWATSRAARVGTAQASLANRRDYRDMRGKGAAKRAAQLRPSLAGRAITNNDLGVRLGRLGRDDLYASEEDVILVVAGPRSNKTSAMVVPSVLSSPGPCITTSNKVDSFALTVALRKQVGQVFTLDPQQMAGVEQTWWWDALKYVRDIADARRLMTHFVATVGGGSEHADPYFTPATERLLCQLTVAAARSKRSLRDLGPWLATRSHEPVELLRQHRQHSAATGLQALLEAPEDQQGGVFETALTALACLESEAVARYVSPPETWDERPRNWRDIVEFDLWQFVVGHTVDGNGQPIPRDTLYALTQEGAGSAAPVVAALVDALLFTCSNAATAQGGRVDPPVRAVLDEAANICPIRNLPDLYSHFGSKSIQIMTFLQSEAQGTALWGRDGMKKLWSSATVKMIGAGLHDADAGEQISKLVGPHDVPTWSDSHGRGGSSTTRSYRTEAIVGVDDIANLTKQEALLLCAGRRSGKIRLLPWYTEPEAGEISDYGAKAVEEIRNSAITALGPSNPLARVLQAQQATTASGSERRYGR